MKKKIIIITIAAAILLFAGFAFSMILNPLNMGISPLIKANGQEQTGRRFEISFSYNKVRLIASSQYAAWIEDMDGNYINTLYVTRYTAKEGYQRRPKSIPKWVSAAQPADMSAAEIDAISGATPRPGEYRVYWDFTDNNGNPVTGTEYRYFFEATMNNDDDALYSGTITIGEDAWEHSFFPEYSIPDSQYKHMIENVRVAYTPN